jgi:hypothetical protein
VKFELPSWDKNSSEKYPQNAFRDD